MASTDVEYHCFVGGLAWAIDNEALEKALSQFSQIIESKVINDCEIGKSRAFGVVTFPDEKPMRDAIEGMNSHDLDGCNITINKAQSCGHGGGGDSYASGPSGDSGGWDCVNGVMVDFVILQVKVHLVVEVGGIRLLGYIMSLLVVHQKTQGLRLFMFLRNSI